MPVVKTAADGREATAKEPVAILARHTHTHTYNTHSICSL